MSTITKQSCIFVVFRIFGDPLDKLFGKDFIEMKGGQGSDDIINGGYLIREGENGFTFAPADSEALRRHVCYFRDHPEEYPRFSAAAMETASCYTWSAYEDRLAVILAELRSTILHIRSSSSLRRS